MKQQYIIELGGYRAPDDYDQLLEVGPYRTRLGAWLAMRLMQGKTVGDALRWSKAEWAFREVDLTTRILGASIAAYDNERGTSYRWEYSANGKLVEHYSML